MRFGLILPSYLPQATPDGMRQAAQLAEELGYDSVWTTDHVMIQRSDTVQYHSVFEVLTTMAWLAAQTSRIKIGVSVLVLPQRHPVLVAKEIATLDRLSAGRIILGVGAGWNDNEFGYLDADFHARGRRMDEGILVMRQLWTEPEKAFRGSFFHFESHSFAPPPAQEGGPPIWVGGRADAALKRAVMYGDGWHSAGGGPEDFKLLADKIAALKPGRKLVLSSRLNVAPAASRTSRYSAPADPAGLRDVVAQYEDAGCSHMMLNFWNGDIAAYQDSVRQFAAQVMSRV